MFLLASLGSAGLHFNVGAEEEKGVQEQRQKQKQGQDGNCSKASVIIS